MEMIECCAVVVECRVPVGHSSPMIGPQIRRAAIVAREPTT